MLWEWTWTGRDILRQVGRFGRSSRWTFALPQPRGTPQTLLAQGRDRNRGGLREGRSVRLPARNLSSPLRSGSGSRVWGGPEVEAVGGVGGAQGTRRGRWFASLGWTECSDWSHCLVLAGLCSAGRCAAAANERGADPGARGWAHGLLLREHRHRGRHAAPAGHPQAGPARGG